MAEMTEQLSLSVSKHALFGETPTHQLIERLIRETKQMTETERERGIEGDPGAIHRCRRMTGDTYNGRRDAYLA